MDDTAPVKSILQKIRAEGELENKVTADVPNPRQAGAPRLFEPAAIPRGAVNSIVSDTEGNCQQPANQPYR